MAHGVTELLGSDLQFSLVICSKTEGRPPDPAPIELQGTAEGASFSEEEMQQMIGLAKSGIAQLVEKQREVLQPILTRIDAYARERLNKKFR